MSESTELITISRIGSRIGTQHSMDMIIVCDDGDIFVNGHRLNWTALRDALADYLGRLRFVELPNTYDTEEQPESEMAASLPPRVWERSQMDPVYTVKLVSGKPHEVSFSYSYCPDYLKPLRILVDSLWDAFKGFDNFRNEA